MYSVRADECDGCLLHFKRRSFLLLNMIETILPVVELPDTSSNNNNAIINETNYSTATYIQRK